MNAERILGAFLKSRSMAMKGNRTAVAVIPKHNTRNEASGLSLPAETCKKCKKKMPYIFSFIGHRIRKATLQNSRLP